MALDVCRKHNRAPTSYVGEWNEILERQLTSKMMVLRAAIERIRILERLCKNGYAEITRLRIRNAVLEAHVRRLERSGVA